MSGPKGGCYEVVSPEELERRALVAANERYQRACRLHDRVLADLRSMGQDERPAGPARGLVSSDVIAEAQALEELTADLSGRLAERRARAAMAAIPSITVDGAAAARPHEAPQPRAVKGTDDEGRKLRAVVEDAIRKWGDFDAARLATTLLAFAEATDDGGRRLARDQLYKIVQGMESKHRLRQEHERQRSEILAVLDGCLSAEAAAVRTAVECAGAGELPCTVEQARRIAARHTAAEDSRFVEAALHDSLQALGYEVHTGISVTVSRDGALLALPDHPRHVAQLRMQSGEIRFNVARIDSATDREADFAAEVDACQLVDALLPELSARGVMWTLERHDPAGSTPMAFFPEPPQEIARASTRRRQRRPQTKERHLS